jgi:hypothetical protein
MPTKRVPRRRYTVKANRLQSKRNFGCPLSHFRQLPAFPSRDPSGLTFDACHRVNAHVSRGADGSASP